MPWVGLLQFGTTIMSWAIYAIAGFFILSGFSATVLMVAIMAGAREDRAVLAATGVPEGLTARELQEHLLRGAGFVESAESVAVAPAKAKKSRRAA